MKFICLEQGRKKCFILDTCIFKINKNIKKPLKVKFVTKSAEKYHSSLAYFKMAAIW